jgi:hyperosmotically inducible protein
MLDPTARTDSRPSLTTPKTPAGGTAFLPLLICLLAALFSPAPGMLHAQQPAANANIQKMAADVSKSINGLTNFGVFDDIRFSFKGGTITLTGYASRPTLKSDAERAVKKIEGITAVDNKIEVLPLSPNDDGIRVRTYNAIYTAPGLSKYNANAGVIRPSITSAAGGITNDPPIGFHAIHIIVKNGHVILRGSVLSKQDSDLAKIRANGVSGVFSVDNQLTIEGAAPVAK